MRFLIASIPILLALAAPPAHCQPGAVPAPAKPALQPGDLCAIEGRVLDAITGEPVKKAAVTLTPSDFKSVASSGQAAIPQLFGTSTDASGHFAMKELDPGTYSLAVTRNGYVSGSYGSRGPGKPGTNLTLSKGQRTSDLVVKLTPQGVVTGRVLDEDGDPVPSVTVQLLKSGYSQGKKQLATAGSAQTDDLGDYRAFGLAPGQYFVTASMSVAAALTGSLSVDRSAKEVPEGDYVATYYPGVTDPSAAAPVDVQAGILTRGIDIELIKARTIRLTGRVNSPAHVALLLLAPRSLAGAISMRMVRVAADGTFEARGVPPGSYALTGSAQLNGKTFSASLPVDVGDANIDNLMFTIGPGVSVTGRVRAEGDAPLDATKLRVRLQQREMGLGALVGALGSALSGGDILGSSGKLGEDLTFRLDDINSDLYDVQVTGLPDGYYIQSVRSGESDVLLSGLAVKGAPPEPLEIVLSPRGGSLDGSVRGADGQPAAHATVALVPKEKERAGHSLFYRDAAIGSDGQFHFKSVPPGEYKLFAWEDVESGAWLDPDFLKPIDDRSVSVTVHAGGYETAEPTLLPAPAGME